MMLGSQALALGFLSLPSCEASSLLCQLFRRKNSLHLNNPRRADTLVNQHTKLILARLERRLPCVHCVLGATYGVDS